MKREKIRGKLYRLKKSGKRFPESLCLNSLNLFAIFLNKTHILYFSISAIGIHFMIPGKLNLPAPRQGLSVYTWWVSPVERGWDQPATASGGLFALIAVVAVGLQPKCGALSANQNSFKKYYTLLQH